MGKFKKIINEFRKGKETKRKITSTRVNGGNLNYRYLKNRLEFHRLLALE